MTAIRQFIGWGLYMLASRIYPPLVDELLDDMIDAINIAGETFPVSGETTQ